MSRLTRNLITMLVIIIFAAMAMLIGINQKRELKTMFKAGYDEGLNSALLINKDMEKLNVCKWAEIVQKHATCQENPNGS